MMEQLFKLPLRCAVAMRDGFAGSLFWVLVSASDILVIACILDGGPLYAYFLARALSLIVPCSLLILEAKASPQLYILVLDNSLFQAAAARVNLGYLMISGAVALMVLLAASQISGMLVTLDASFKNILLWMLIGQVSPILFGATRMLMQVMQRRIFYNLLTLITTALFLTGAVVMPYQSAISVAQALAAAQLAQAGVCALLLTQCGVWPGLTALLHREIKLF